MAGALPINTVAAVIVVAVAEKAMVFVRPDELATVTTYTYVAEVAAAGMTVAPARIVTPAPAVAVTALITVPVYCSQTK